MPKEPLPIVKNKKKIDEKKFTALAKKIKKYFEEENEYLDKKRNENSSSSRIPAGY